jgi:hypothetical protein
MTTSVKNVAAYLQNIGNSLINPHNYDDNNYGEVSDVTQSKSISHGSDFYTYQLSLKNRATEGFNGHNALTHASQSVLLKTQISAAQQQELTRLQGEYALNQLSYNSLINTISPTAIDNSAKILRLAQLETTLDILSRQINTLNDSINKNIISVNDQISTNSSAREKYMRDITNNAAEKANMLNISNNIQHMLNDSDITTLQKNYSYILLSILAAASILVAMNVIKNN